MAAKNLLKCSGLPDPLRRRESPSLKHGPLVSDISMKCLSLALSQKGGPKMGQQKIDVEKIKLIPFPLNWDY